MRLLPFERQLIEELGCTEEEYLRFKQQVDWLNRNRPAEYDSIPDIQNEASLIVAIVSLVLGLVSTAASLLMMPKLQQPKASENRQLDSIAGRDRFAPTYGFQASQELSRYGETIPIVFTQQKQVQLNINGSIAPTIVGGIMIAPKLVWSRINSWDSYQSLSMVFLLGQSPMKKDASDDERAGIYVGQLPLDSLPEGDYRWYYYEGAGPVDGTTTYRPLPGSTHQATDSRLIERDRRYGTFRLTDTEGPDSGAFPAQTFAGLDRDAFCHTFTPSSNTKFGVYSALPNGTSYRVNWEVVSYPSQDPKPNNPRAAIARRFYIAGNAQMAGTGRNYARQFGIVAHNGVEYPAGQQNNGTKVNVVKGDTVTIIYNAGRVRDELYYDNANVNIRDNVSGRWDEPKYINPDPDVVDNKGIKSAIQTEHEQQDDALNIGTRWLIGNAMYEVVSRSPDRVYDKTDTEPYSVVLKCIATFSDGNPVQVGVCDRGFLTTNTNMPENEFGPLYRIGAAWFPICKVEIANIQNTRRCEVTEIGIKSNVWNRFNGICNFNSIPSVPKLLDYDGRNVQLTTGTTQAYSRRCSFFNLYVRPANNTFDSEGGWEKLNQFPFCVVGSSPQDQYNFIRIGQPFDQFEYRLRPVNSGEIGQIIGVDSRVNIDGVDVLGPCIRLHVDGGPVTANKFYRHPPVTTRYGTFMLFVRGFIDSISDLRTNSEMISDPVSTSNAGIVALGPQTVRFLRAYSYRDNGDANLMRISNGIAKAINKDPDPEIENISGQPEVPYFSIPVGGEYQFTDADKATFTYSEGGRSASLNMLLRAVTIIPDDPAYTRRIYWSIVNNGSIPVTLTGNWQAGEVFFIQKQLFDGSRVDYYFQVNEANQIRLPSNVTGDRVFDYNSAISEVSFYNDLISRSCDNGPEHEITHINENLTNRLLSITGRSATYQGCTMAGIVLRSSINITSFEQLHVYQKNGIQVVNLRRAAAGSITETVNSSNIFTDLAYYLLTNSQTGAGELISPDLIDKTQLARTGSFLEANNLYYDDVIVEPQNLREFLSRISASLLCNLVTRGGKFSIEPALPIDESRSYTMFDVPVPIRGIFTEGNIIEDSFQLEYIPAQDRQPIRAMVAYRTELPNRFPQEQTAVVYYTDQPNGPLEEFKFTHITSRYHAEIFAKFALSSRRRRDHMVTFKTLPYGLSLAPGDFIRVVTQSGYSAPTATGVIKDDGAIVSPSSFTNGQSVNVYYWDRAGSQVSNGSFTITYKNGQPFADRLFNSIFSIVNTNTQALVYMVDSIQLDEDGMVEITASHFPVDTNNYSIIANELKPSYNGFTTVADLAPD